MDSLSKSNLNFFISNKIDRSSDKRKNGGWLNEKLHGSDSLIIPLFNLKSPFGAGPVPLYLNSEDNLPEKLLEESVLLGESGGKIYFALDISGYEKLKESFQGKGEFRGLRETAPVINPDEAAFISYARSMVYWHASHKFCGVCGARTEPADAGHRRICTSKDCGTEHFPRTDPAIIVLVSKGDRCLLARQARWAPKQYATIAGFVEPGETLEQAVQREVGEETGVLLKEINYHSSQPWPFPGAIMLGFHAEAATEEITLYDHELEDAIWISREEISTRLKEGTLRLSPRFSISYRLIETWFDGTGDTKLGSVLDELAKS